MNDRIRNFRDLDVWKLGIEIAELIYLMTKSYPKDEIYNLVSQMRRSAVSISSNIAEGFNRFHNKEYVRFLYIALGSVAELETQIEISFRLKYLSDEKKEQALEKLDHESRMLRNLIKKLQIRDS